MTDQEVEENVEAFIKHLKNEEANPRQMAQAVGIMLINAFDWHSTKMDGGFWAEAHQQLMRRDQVV